MLSVFLFIGVDKRILVWDLAEGTLLTELKGHSDTVYSLRFSRDGNMLASGMRASNSFSGEFIQGFLLPFFSFLFELDARELA